MLKTLYTLIITNKLGNGSIKINEKNRTICFEDEEAELSLKDREGLNLKEQKLF